MDGEMVLSECGEVADNYWKEIPRHYENVRLDRFVVMSNHVHRIIEIVGSGESLKRVSISRIIKSFKEVTTKHIRSEFGISFHWQRSFYDHIVRDQEDLMRIRAYIAENPLNWSQDDENISDRQRTT